MAVFFAALCLFFGAWAGHVIIWRISLPRRPALFLFAYFSLVLFVATGFNTWAQLNHLGGIIGYRFSIVELVHIAGLYLTAMITYVTLHSAITVTSPTFLVLMSLHKAGNEGRSRDDLDRLVNDETYCINKLKELVSDQNAEERDGRLFITAKGRKLMAIFTWYLDFIGMREQRG